MKTNLLFALLFIPFMGWGQASDFQIEIGKPYSVVDADIKDFFIKDGIILAVKVKDNVVKLLPQHSKKSRPKPTMMIFRRNFTWRVFAN